MDAGVGWADLEIVEAIAEGGSMSAAARRLGVDQTTVSRRLAAFERRLGARLFDRVGARMQPTPALASASGRLGVMREAAELAFAALGRAQAEMQGLARVSSLDLLIVRALAPAVGAFHARHPGVSLELRADNALADFARRETDIALRLGRAADDHARVKTIGELRFRLCRPTHAAEAPGAAPLVRYTAALAHLPEMRLLDRLRPAGRAVVTVDRLDSQIAAALALGAEVMLPEVVLRDDARFVAATDVDETAARPIRRLTHADRAAAASVRAAGAWIDEAVARWLAG